MSTIVLKSITLYQTPAVEKNDLFQNFSVEMAAYSQTYLPEYYFLSKLLYIQITAYNT